MLKDRQPHDEPTEQDERTRGEVHAGQAGNDARADEMHDSRLGDKSYGDGNYGDTNYGDRNYARVDDTPHTTHVTHADDYEERIREDERARVMKELRALRDEHPDHARDDRVVVDDRAVDDDRVVRDERLVRDRDDGDRFDRDAYERDGRERDDYMLVREDEKIDVVRKRSFSFGQLLTMLVGGALVALGIGALVETGIDTPLSEPIEPVLGWDHTPLLGILEIAAGALLVLFSLRPGGRWMVALVGAALVAGGIMVAAETDWTVDELGAEQGFAWVPIVAGAVALLAALLTPRRYQRSSGVPVVDEDRRATVH